MGLRLAVVFFLVIGALNAAPSTRSRSQQQSPASIDNARDALRSLCKSSENSLNSEVPSDFIELTQSIRNLPKSEIDSLWNEVKSRQLCPSNDKLQDFLRDAMINDGSEGSVGQLVRLIDSSDLKGAKLDYALTMLAFAKEPTPEGVRELIPILRKPDQSRQVLLGASGYIQNLCRNQEQSSKCSQLSEARQAVKAIADTIPSKCAARNQDQVDRIVVKLTAIKNIGAVADVREKLLECATEKSNRNSIRAAAMWALSEAVDKKAVESKLWEVLKDRKEDAELRIFAYKQIMRGANDREPIEKLKQLLEREDSKQVGSYIVSHLKNLKKTSDPKKQRASELVQDFQIPKDRFPKDLTKYSRNIEMSQVYGQVGSVVDSNIVFNENAKIPVAANFKVSFPVFGVSFPAFEICARQVNIDQLAQNIAFSAKDMMNKKPSEVLQSMVDYFDSSKSSSSGNYRSGNSRRSGANRIAGSSDDEFRGHVSIGIDGKTLVHLSANDFTEEKIGSLRDLVKDFGRKLDQLKQQLAKDNSVSLNFLDYERKIKKEDGSGFELDLNGTIVAAYNGKDNKMMPSLAVEVSMKAGPSNGEKVKIVNRFLTAPSMQSEVEYKNGRPIKMTLDLPEPEQTLFKVESRVYQVDQNDNEREIKKSEQTKQVCSKSTDKWLGFKVCAKASKPSEIYNKDTPIIPISGPFEVEVKLEKTDKSMSGWEYTFEIPESRQSNAVYRFGFNTPGSRENRERKVEIQIQRQQEGAKVQVQGKCPHQEWQASASYKYTDDVASVQSEMNTNSKKYQLNAEIKRSADGRVTVFEPKFELNAPEVGQMGFDGQIRMDNPRGNQKPKIEINLKNTQNPQYYVKGDITRDGPLNRDQFKMSISLDASLQKGLKYKVFGTTEKQNQQCQSQLDVKYERPGKSGEQSLKVIGKHGDNKNRQNRKITSFFELKSSESPEWNVQITQNAQRKPSEHSEAELTVRWSRDFQDDRKSAHFLHSWKKSDSKVNGRVQVEMKGQDIEMDVNLSAEKQSSSQSNVQFDSKFENKIRIGKKANIHYVTSASGYVDKSSRTPSFKVAVKSVNKRLQDRTTSASFEYKHISRKPLKISLDASIEAGPEFRVSYTDSLEEVQPNQIKGRSMVQWGAGGQKKTTLDYSYKRASDSEQSKHEVDLNLQTPSDNYKHRAMLRMTRNEIQIQSAHAQNEREAYNCDALYNRRERSMIDCKAQGFSGKFESRHSDSIRGADLSFKLDRHQLEHATSFQSQPGKLNLNSRTIYKQKPLYSWNSDLNRANPVVTFSAGSYKGKLEGTRSSRNSVFNVEVSNDQLAHQTKWQSEQGRQGVESIVIKSKTRRGQSEPLLDIDGQFNRQSPSSFNVKAGQWSASANAGPLSGRSSHEVQVEITNPRKAVAHKTTIQINSQSKTFGADSSTQVKGQEWFNLKSNVDLRRQSTIQVKIPSIRTQMDMNLDGKRSGKMTLKSRSLTHTLDLNNDDSIGAIWSTVNRQGDKLAQFNANMARGSKITNLNAQSPHLGFFNLRVEPSRSAKLEMKRGKAGQESDFDFEHSSEIGRSGRAWTLMSQTQHKRAGQWLLDGKMDPSQGSHLKLDSPRLESQLLLNPFASDAKSARFTIKQKTMPFHHETECKLTNSGTKLTIASQTKTPKGRVYGLDTVIARHEPSRVFFKSPNTQFKSTLNPIGKSKTVSIELTGPNMQLKHDSNLNQESTRITVASKSDWNGRNIYDLDSKLSRHSSDLSHLNLKTALGQASVEYEPRRSGKIELRNDRFYHRSALAKRTDHFAFDSETKKHDQVLAIVNGQISRQFRSAPSKVEIQIPTGKGLIRIQPKRELEIGFNGQNLVHSTLLSRQNSQLNIHSNTQRDGKQLYELKCDLHPKRSTIGLDTEAVEGELGFNVASAVKTGRIAFKSKARQDPIQHMTEGAYRTGKLTINSMSKSRRGLNYKLDTTLNRNEPSIIDFTGFGHALNAHLNPEGQTKTIKLDISGPKINLEHETSFARAGSRSRSIDLASKTQWQGKKLYNVKSLLDSRRPSIQLETPFASGSIHGQFDRNAGQHEISFDGAITGRHARRIIGASKFNAQQRSLDADLKWDADRDQQKSIKIVMMHKPQSSSASGYSSSWSKYSSTPKQYQTKLMAKHGKGYEFNWDSSLTSNALLSGPHNLKVVAISPRNQWHVSGEHQFANQRIQSKANWLKNQQPIFTLDSDLSRQGRSQMSVKSGPISGQVQAQLWKDGSITIQHPSFAHKTQMNVERDSFAFESDTKHRETPVAVIAAQISRHGPSHATIKTSRGNANFRLVPRSELEFGVDSPQLVLKHSTNLKKADGIQILSETDLKGHKYNVNGNLNYGRSTIQVVTPNHRFSSELKQGDKKHIQLTHNDLTHLSELLSDRTSMSFNSKTERNGQPLLNIESKYDPQSTSFIRCEHPHHTTNVEVQLQPQLTGKVLIKSKRGPFSHEMTAIHASDDASCTLRSATTTPSGRKFEIDSLISRRSPSHLNYKDEKNTVQIQVKPIGSSKSISLTCKTPRHQLEHLTSLDSSRSYLLKSKTQLNNRNIYDVTGDFNRFKPSLQGESEYISGKVSAELQRNSNRIDLDLRSKLPRERRILGMAQVLSTGSKSGIQSHLKWDADRDESKMFQLDGSVERTSSGWRQPGTYKTLITSKFGPRYSYDLESELAENVKTGPHRLVIRTRAPQSQYELNADHQITGNEVRCNCDIKRNQEQIASLNSLLAGGRSKSNINLKYRDSSALAEYEPAQKAMIQLQSGKYFHRSQVRADQPQMYQVESVTRANRRPLANIQCHVSTRPGTESSGIVKFPSGEALIRMTPGQEMELNVNTRDLSHKTLVRHARSVTDFESSTRMSNRNVADIKGQFKKGQTSVKLAMERSEVQYEYKKGDKASLDVEGINLNQKMRDAMRSVTKQMKAKCSYYSSCHQIAREYEQNGFRGAHDKLWSMIGQRYNSIQSKFVNWWNQRLPAIGEKTLNRINSVGGMIGQHMSPSNLMKNVQLSKEESRFRIMYNLA